MDSMQRRFSSAPCAPSSPLLPDAAAGAALDVAFRLRMLGENQMKGRAAFWQLGGAGDLKIKIQYNKPFMPRSGLIHTKMEVIKHSFLMFPEDYPRNQSVELN